MLALRGTCRVIRSGARNLSLEPWFMSTWKRALGVSAYLLPILPDYMYLPTYLYLLCSLISLFF